MIDKLPIDFNCKGFAYKCIIDDESGYVYQVDSDGHKFYEVFEKRLVPICIDFASRTYSESEFRHRYPRNEDFGVWAWTYPTLERAKVKLGSLVTKSISNINKPLSAV